jgi:CheY-like chemotaxis protein
MNTVLVVDDDFALLREMSGLLRTRHYSVVEFSDPRGVLEFAELCQELDLLITDFNMPYIDGISLAENLRRTRPLLQTLLMTGSPMSLSAAGYQGSYLRKPFTSRELFREIDRLFQTSSPGTAPLLTSQ